MVSNSSVSLKLFIDTKSKKLLFAEAEKEFVDFLFNIMALPVGTVIRLLTKDSMVGSLGNIYDSIETMNEKYLENPDLMKESLLRPKFSSSSRSQVPLLPDYASLSRKFYSCICYKHSYISDDPNSKCPSYRCNSKLSRELAYVTESESQVMTSGNNNDECYLSDCGEGFVKGIATYVVMDDLVVKPMSSFTMLKSFNIKDIGEIEEKVVPLDLAEGVKLLKASLQSKTVLTSVFMDDNDMKATDISDCK